MSITHPAQIVETIGGVTRPLGDVLDSLGTFTPPGTGGISRSITDKLGDVLSVKDYGAKCDGVTDDTAAIQAMSTNLSSASATLIVPGPCVVNAPVTIPSTLKVRFESNGSFIGSGAVTYAPWAAAAQSVARAVTDAGFAAGDGATTAFQLQATPVTLKADTLGTWANGTKPRTNLAWWSQAFDNAVWVKNTGVLVTADNVTAPDGTLTADKIAYDGTGASGTYRVYWGGGFPSVFGRTYTHSVWLRADSTITIAIGDTFSGSVAQPVTLSTTWRRFSITSTAFSAASYKLHISSAPGTNTAFTIYAWGAQIEQGPTATQYIPTTGANATSTPAYWPAAGDGFSPVFYVRQAQLSEIGLVYQPLNLGVEGDSITQIPSPIGGVTSWPALLNFSAASGARYTDWAVSGTRTADMLARFTAYQGNGYSHFIILGGINDITQDVPIATTQANLTSMWSGARSLGMSVVVMTVPPFKNDTAADWTIARQSTLDALNAWIRQQATANGYALIDTYALLGDPVNPQQQLAAYTSDGKHPSTAGQQVIANAVKAALTTFAQPRYLGTPTITLEGDWQGKRILYSTPRTNLCTQSTPGASWAGQVSGTGVAPTVTYNFAAAPDGTTTATRAQLNQGAGTTASDLSSFVGPTITTTPATTYTLSVWLKTNDATTKKVKFDFGGATTTTVSVTGIWQRFSFTATGIVSASPRLQVRGTFGTDTTADLLIWGVQVETGNAPTQLIPTTSATVTVTDYTLGSTGVVTLAAAPVANAALAWSGGYLDRGISP